LNGDMGRESAGFKNVKVGGAGFRDLADGKRPPSGATALRCESGPKSACRAIRAGDSGEKPRRLSHPAAAPTAGRANQEAI
jgi:hypothetical protein